MLKLIRSTILSSRKKADKSLVQKSANPEELGVDTRLAPAYDISALKSLVGVNTTGLYQIISSFIEQTPQEVKLLAEAIEREDWKAMGSQAHKLKSNLKLFGLETITSDLQLLESVGKGLCDRISMAEIQVHLQKIESTFAGAIAQLPQELPSKDLT